MLMVIFGAGASYDSLAVPPNDISWQNFRPPLANQLFDWRFREDIAQFSRCKPVIPYLQQAGVNVERELERLQGEADKDPERKRQLAAIRYYLQVMLSRCQDRWTNVTKGVTNYGTLLDQIRHNRKSGEKVCLVTFNYDTLLEEALRTLRIRFSRIDDYVATDYLVIKPHGSINWARPVLNNVANLQGRSHQDIAIELIEEAPNLRLDASYLTTGFAPIGKSDGVDPIPLFPALAIPVEKKSSLECPPSHVAVLAECLTQVTKILVIGWRAAESQFVNSLAGVIREDVRAMVVSSSVERANEVIGRMKAAGVSADFLAASGGFSQILLSREGENFLAV